MPLEQVPCYILFNRSAIFIHQLCETVFFLCRHFEADMEKLTQVAIVAFA